MQHSTKLTALVLTCAILLSFTNTFAETYVFGALGLNTDLTASGAGSYWLYTDEFIIAGDCYVPDDATLLIGQGVTVKFDDDYNSDPIDYPEIEVRGSIICTGTELSPVTFTNYSGTNKGEFKGIYLNGAAVSPDDYEGSFTGTNVNFYYGGYSDGIIRVGEDATLDLQYCIIRHSDNHGIYLDDTGGLVELSHCQVDSNDVDGLTWSQDESDNGTMRVEYSSFVDNATCAIRVPRRDPYRAEEGFNIFNKIFFSSYTETDNYFILIYNISAFGEITNCYFFRTQEGIFIMDTYCPKVLGTQYKWEITNNVFCHCKTGVLIDELDYTEDEVSYLKIDLFNNVFWNHLYCNSVGGIGVDIVDWGDPSYCSDDNDWPSEYLNMERNIFGKLDGTYSKYHIRFTGEEGREFDVPASNAFDDEDEVLGVDISGCIVDNDDDVTVTLADESGSDADPDSYDFHIEWDGNNSLINYEDEVEPEEPDDPDGTKVDLGCYGGPLGNEGVGTGDENGSPGGINVNPGGAYGWMRDPFYIDLGEGGIEEEELELLLTEYAMFDDFVVDENCELTINDLVTVIAQGDYRFEVDGVLKAEASSWGNLIEFCDGTDGADEWRGIYLTTDATTDCAFKNVKISGVSENFTGLKIYNIDEGDEGSMTIDNVEVDDCGTGIMIRDSKVIMTDCKTTHSEYYGTYVYDITAGDVKINHLQSNNNYGSHTYSSGLRLLNASPTITDNSSYAETNLYYNEKYGMHCDYASSPNLSSAGAGYTNINFLENEYSQIYLNRESYPTINGGENNVDRGETEAWAVRFGNTQTYTWDAENTWWGTTEEDEWDEEKLADEDELFSDPSKIVYYPWAEEEWCDDANAFDIAVGLMNRDNYEAAIPYLERAVYDEDIGGHRFSALSYLRGCYKQSDGDFDDLYDFYDQVCEDFEGEPIAFTAETQAIWALNDQRLYKEVVDAFTARRETIDNRADSLRNEVELLRARMGLIDCDDEFVDGFGKHPNSDMWFEENFERLDNLLNEELEKGALSQLTPATIQLNATYPNPFNSSTRISYDLNELMNVEVAVFDLNGQLVEVLDSGERNAGAHNLIWDAEGVASGVYFVRLSTPAVKQTQKVLLIR
ncbi:T9SS type A sorting domain-containing protein [bacterium]|nr:T9SS type A sorting domain-containing protein [bacterium]